MNIRFSYLYRDAGNFKNWGEVVLSNPQNLSVDTISKMVEKNIYDTRTFFSAEKAGVPNLRFKETNAKLDHDWHEIDTFYDTDHAPNDAQGRDVHQLIEALRSALLK